jgi:folate-binding protein YgfZ
MSSPQAFGEGGAIVVPEPARDTLRVAGADAKTWLNGVLSSDVSKLTGRQGVYGLLLSKQGKVQAELDLVEGQDAAVWIGVSAGRGERVQEQLDRVLVMEDAELTREPSVRWLRFHGPKAVEIAFSVQERVAAGAIDWLGVGGAALALPEVAVPAALASARAAGAQEVDAEHWHALRIRQGFPSFGSDFTDEDNPHEASLDRRAVSWTKGCYLGQEVVCMQDMRGRVKRRLVALELDGAAPAIPGSELESPGEAGPVGRITSAARDGRSVVALARVKFPFFEGSHPLSMGGRAARILKPAPAGGGSFEP